MTTYDETDLLTVQETASYLTVGAGSVNYWRHKKVGPRFVRVGRQIRYRRSDLDQWIEDRTESPAEAVAL